MTVLIATYIILVRVLKNIDLIFSAVAKVKKYELQSNLTE